MSDSVTSWTAACQASLSFTISWSLLKLMFTESVVEGRQGCEPEQQQCVAWVWVGFPRPWGVVLCAEP